MYDRQPVSEYEITPDGYLRRSGRIMDISPNPESQVDLGSISSSNDADAEAAKAYMRVAQTPLQTVGIPGT